MSTFGEGPQGGEETAVPAVGGDQQQHSMGQISRLLGRAKCFSGRKDEWHDWSLKFGAIAATLSDHASVWVSGALQHTSEITLDQPDEASARIFARQMYTLLIHLCEGRALAIVRGKPDHNGLEAWRLYEGLGECDAGGQQNCKCATTGRGAGGRADFSISEGSSDIPACTSAGGNSEIEPCATVAL